VCLSELLAELKRAGVVVSESQIRWAIKSGKVSRPRVDRSLRFDFSAENVAELAMHFSDREVSHAH
jgi:hypothetical protein